MKARRLATKFNRNAAGKPRSISRPEAQYGTEDAAAPAAAASGRRGLPATATRRLDLAAIEFSRDGSMGCPIPRQPSAILATRLRRALRSLQRLADATRTGAAVTFGLRESRRGGNRHGGTRHCD